MDKKKIELVRRALEFPRTVETIRNNIEKGDFIEFLIYEMKIPYGANKGKKVTIPSTEIKSELSNIWFIYLLIFFLWLLLKLVRWFD